MTNQGYNKSLSTQCSHLSVLDFQLFSGAKMGTLAKNWLSLPSVILK